MNIYILLITIEHYGMQVINKKKINTNSKNVKTEENNLTVNITRVTL